MSPQLQERMQQLGQSATPQQAEQVMREERANTLNDLIKNLLVKKEAARFQIEVSEGEVDRYLQSLAQQNKFQSIAELRKAVEESGEYGAWSDYKQDIRDQLVIYKTTQSLANFAVTDAAVREQYRKMTRGEESKVEVERFLFTPDAATAAARDAVYSKAQGRPGACAPARPSTRWRPSTGLAGKTRKTIGRGEVAPAVEDAIFAAAQGAVVGPLETGQGYLVLKIVQHMSSDVLSFEQAKERIRARSRRRRLRRRPRTFGTGCWRRPTSIFACEAWAPRRALHLRAFDGLLIARGRAPGHETRLRGPQRRGEGLPHRLGAGERGQAERAPQRLGRVGAGPQRVRGRGPRRVDRSELGRREPRSRPCVDRPRELRVAALVVGDRGHERAQRRIFGRLRLVGGQQRGPGLAHAALDRVLERQRDQRTRLRGGERRCGDRDAEAPGLRRHGLGVAALIVGGSERGGPQHLGRAASPQLVGQPLERGHARRLEVGRAGQPRAETVDGARGEGAQARRAPTAAAVLAGIDADDAAGGRRAWSIPRAGRRRPWRPGRSAARRRPAHA
jgi:peptidyl-prolyl cis-trans isomerase SurA